MSSLFTRRGLTRFERRFRAIRPTTYVPAPRVTWSRVSFRMSHAVKYDLIDHSSVIEEEKLSHYKPTKFYPVHIGEIFQDRYKVIGKLGYGSASTVWLCRDACEQGKYVALKVYINCSKWQREIPIYDHINGLDSQHGGRGHTFIRKLLDSFEIKGPNGEHFCLVCEALGMSMQELRDLVPDRMLHVDIVRECLRGILRGLHFLHEEAHIIHTGKTNTTICFCSHG